MYDLRDPSSGLMYLFPACRSRRLTGDQHVHQRRLLFALGNLDRNHDVHVECHRTCSHSFFRERHAHVDRFSLRQSTRRSASTTIPRKPTPKRQRNTSSIRCWGR